MALVLADRVQETSTTTGTGTLTLAGASSGYQTFSAGIGNGNTCYYTIQSDTGAWEVGVGTVGAGTLARTTLISSSTGSAISFSGTLTVFVTYPAEKAVYGESTAIVAPSGALLPVASGGTGVGTLTGYVKANGTAAMTASATIPSADLTGVVTSVTGTAPVASSGGTTPAISMAAATASVNGYLTSTDWSTFNAKLTSGGALGTPSSGTVTNLTGTASININGTVGATTPGTGAFTTLSASSTVSGTGFTNYFASPPAIGGTSAAAGSFTTLNSSGATRLGGLLGNQSLQVNNVASAVNYAQVVGAVTTGTPVISAQGSDTNISLRYQPKGTGSSLFLGGDGTAQFLISSTVTAVNFFQVYGSPTGSSPALNAIGTDTNINIIFTPKGSGTLQFGTYTAGIVAQAGYITITDAGGTSRRLLVG
jgi:hypothetical protein